MFIISTATFIIKMSCSTTMTSVSFNIRFVDSKSPLKSNSWNMLSNR